MHRGDHPPAGYYTDPDNARVQRWWDGGAWALQSDGVVHRSLPVIETQRVVHTNQFAMASLVLSLSWIFFIGSILGVIFGHLAMAQIRQSQGGDVGRGSAMIGLIVGYVGIVCGVLLALIVAG